MLTLQSRRLHRQTLGTFKRAYGAAYKGAKRLMGKRQREDEAIRACMAVLSADELGLQGKDRQIYIIEQAGLPRRTEVREIRKLANLGRTLLGMEKNERLNGRKRTQKSQKNRKARRRRDVKAQQAVL